MTRNCYRTIGIFAILYLLAVVGQEIALAGETAGQDFTLFRNKEMAEIEAKLESIPASDANDPLVSTAKSVAKDTDAIVAEVMESLNSIRMATMGSEAVGDPPRKTSTAINASQANQVRDVYVRYHDRINKNVTLVSVDTPEGKIAKEYINATLAVAENYILNEAGKIKDLGADIIAAEWAMLLPLLHHGDSAWNIEWISNLPVWIKNTQSMNAAEYICLAVGCPKAAYQLWAFHVSDGKDETLKVENYLANLHRRANACFGSKDFLKGINILKSIIILADTEGMIDEAVKSHFRLAEVYTMYGHSQMAADEMKLMMKDYPTHKEYGKAVLMRLRYLYQSGMFEKILEETPTLLKDNASENYRPQIIYIAWVTNRRQNKTMEADDLKKRFIRGYPNHPLCADMYFASAMELLAAGDYAGATQLLEMIAERYEKTSIANKSREILAKLKESQKPPSGTPASSPNGG